MTQFQILFDAIDLAKAGRKHSAKAQWKSLRPEFKAKAITFLIEALQTKEPLRSTFELRSPYGDFILNDPVISDIKSYLPELALNGDA